MKKLVLKKYKVTQLNNLSTINGGDGGDLTGNETVGTVNDKKNKTIIDVPTQIG